MRLALVCFYCLCVFVYVLYFIATMSFAGYFLSVLFCMLSMLISDSLFDLVWFRLSCDHGWIRSGSVNVRKQQQQLQTPYSERTRNNITAQLRSENLAKLRNYVKTKHHKSPQYSRAYFAIVPKYSSIAYSFTYFCIFFTVVEKQPPRKNV